MRWYLIMIIITHTNYIILNLINLIYIDVLKIYHFITIFFQSYFIHTKCTPNVL